MHRSNRLQALKAACLVAGAAWTTPAKAEELRQGGKLLLTRGISTVEGAGGGGIATWSLITGNETDAGIGASGHVTHVALPDFDLTSAGIAIGIKDRVELSYTRQSFDTRTAGALLGLGAGFKFNQDVFGLKLRLVGDAVYDQDRLLPQISVGIQHKRADKGAVITAVGGAESRGTDFHVSATKLVLSKSLLLNGTVRFTKANQLGLLGFGGDRSNRYSAQFEGSAAVMLSRRFVVGAEWRTKPDNLGFAREQNAKDVFAAWAVTRNLTLSAAYADLGDIATVRRQRGAFLQVQAGF